MTPNGKGSFGNGRAAATLLAAFGRRHGAQSIHILQGHHGFQIPNAPQQMPPNPRVGKIARAIPFGRIDKINHVIAHARFDGIDNGVGGWQLFGRSQLHGSFKLVAGIQKDGEFRFRYGAARPGAFLGAHSGRNQGLAFFGGGGVEMEIKMRRALVERSGRTVTQRIPIELDLRKEESRPVRLFWKGKDELVATTRVNDLTIAIQKGPVVVAGCGWQGVHVRGTRHNNAQFRHFARSILGDKGLVSVNDKKNHRREQKQEKGEELVVERRSNKQKLPQRHMESINAYCVNKPHPRDIASCTVNNNKKHPKRTFASKEAIQFSPTISSCCHIMIPYSCSFLLMHAPILLLYEKRLPTWLT
mmetsp:Transcript_26419/g.55259  ORF Transcript_26419/g.55259 Transcript_26419/m.55259 type:complete len:359 (+) Transcript_26419:1839-2915(+)